ncbi:site-specific integrase [Comamonas sp. Tr-654]|uniref:tyrosine-type recombinase/integrase n=1 Tax=Comamonas sp. Tr-654 TaxID=2608341 RepID=UPI00142019C1|nr:site-specific integrase [Comamonas sp. Tr-654]NIF82728.1 site-specific integrase [Comamonas sp. Tr-654]
MLSDEDSADCFPGSCLEEFSSEWVIKRSIESDTLPKYFPILVEENSGQICEPVLLFLLEKRVRSGRHLSINSRIAYCKDLKEWFTYLDNVKINWLEVRQVHLDAFVTILDKTISPTICELLAVKTITRMSTTVREFYKWSKKNLSINNNNLSDKSLFLEQSVVTVEPRDQNKDDDSGEKNVLQFHEARKLFSELGVLPSKQNGNYQFSCRDRLACELALSAGLRIGDVTHLSVSMIERYRNGNIEDTRIYPIRLVGKGRKVANVKFPGWVIKESLAYIDGERNFIVNKTGIQANLLIINGLGAGGCAGRPVSHRTLQRRFSDACKRAGLVRFVEKYTIGSFGQKISKNDELVERAQYVFHDLRHTYAIWTYYARKRGGDSEPWIFISTQLRHANVLTTIKFYLKTASDFEAVVSDTFMDCLHEKYSI